jgi:hypothetical protein
MTNHVRRIAPLCLVLGLMGSATTAVRDSSVTGWARLTIENLTSYAWQIAAVPTQGGEAHSARVTPQGSAVLSFPAGEYALEQTRLDAAGVPVEARRLVIRFEGGGNYQWPLATLLSGGGPPLPGEASRP